jgi:hypothetical protein
MTAITIELQDELAERLAAEARRRNVTVSELLAQSAEILLSEPGDDFSAAVRRVIQEDRELLKRLA